MSDILARLSDALATSYRVEREIGQGGMATVFLATDLKHGRPVAIKVLRPEIAASLGHERFLREIEIAARLQHPHILPVYDSGTAGSILYYVMPFVEGESLRDRLVRAGPLPPGEAVRLAREIADALDYAHRFGVVHRDIKPANILISQGNAVVADFGIARAVTASAATAGLTQAGMAVGTPAYMSPEQALGDQTVDGRTDIYALGAVLHEMLTGKPPFEGTTPQSIVGQALSGKIPPLLDDALGLGPVIARAMAREPSDRFGTAGDLRAALDGLSSGTRAVAVARPRRRPAILAGAALLALAAIVAVVVVARRGGAEANPRQSLIVFPFENKTGDPGREYLSEAAMNLLGLAAAHWTDMRVHDDERTASLLRRRKIGSAADLDFEAARAMAREARVGTLVMGDIRREGDSLAIEAKVHDVRTGDRIATHIERTAWGGDPRPLFDRLAGRILGTSGAPPGERPSLLTQTTTSIEAYRAYLDGSNALQRFEIDSARRALERAVELDSTFALAFIRLRDVEGWSLTDRGGRQEVRRRYVLAAERYSGSLPPRLKSLVAFHRAYEDGDFRRARRVAEEMIARDSGDVEAWYQLGEAHYHNGAGQFPHPDTLGNMGKALRSFQRALALDSTYMLAYQHILDALNSCIGVIALACGPDSAVYGAAQDLERRLGAEGVRLLRDQARQAQVATARGWVTTAPGVGRARLALVRALYQQRRYDEALTEIEAARRIGGASGAGFWHALILFQRGDPGPAATMLDSTLRATRDTLAELSGIDNFFLPAVLLAGSGRVTAADRLVDRLLGGIPIDSVPGPGMIMLSKPELGAFLKAGVHAQAADARAAGLVREVVELLERRAGRDSALARRAARGFGSGYVHGYLLTGDTLYLTRFLRGVDTLGSEVWGVADALLALEGGDTARARARVDRHYRTPAPAEFAGEQGVIRAFAWGTMLARLGEPRLAVEAFARLDSAEARIQHPGLLVRSWAERGELYHRLGDTRRAAEHYQKFLDAWVNADPELQPQVERVRKALAVVKGELAPEPRR
ncbi:MAG TPA: protein kinase [Gemmatimonadales bacterium]|nr:protein kinase [Gemmatimonadales bacterium]